MKGLIFNDALEVDILSFLSSCFEGYLSLQFSPNSFLDRIIFSIKIAYKTKQNPKKARVL